MGINKALFSSATDEWETPRDFFEALNAEFHFTLDPCSTDENAKCAKHYTRREDGLAQDWTGETVYCNPPYGREMPKWIQKCAEHAAGGGYGSHADTREDRHKGFSRVHLWQGRDSVHPGPVEVRRGEKLRAIPINGCDFQGRDKMFDVNTAVFNAIHRGAIVYGLRMPNGETLVTIDNQHGWVMEEADMQFNPAKLNREKALPFSMDCVGDEKCRLTLCDKLSIYPGFVKAVFYTQTGEERYINPEYLCEITDTDIHMMHWLFDGEYEYYCAGEREPIYICNRVGEDLMVCGVVMPINMNEAKP